MNITRAELKAAIGEAHRRHLKITGHLCSVTYPEAAALGIDDLEHGFFVNTQLDPGKQPDKCSAGGDADAARDEPGQPGSECSDQVAGRPPCRGDLDAAGVRAGASAAWATQPQGDGHAHARGARRLSLHAQHAAQPRLDSARSGVRAGLPERHRPGAAVRCRRRAADGGARPDRQRRRHPRLRRPARAGASGRGRLHAA